ncbi:MAG TPA: hypothetical protein VFZ69_14605 [Longimicrobiales bacterium]
MRPAIIPFALAVIAPACARPDSDPLIEEYRPSPGLDRLGFTVLDGDDIGLVGDFDIRGDTVFLLDRAGGVAVVERIGGSARLVARFARRGPGPGEFLQPTGMAATRDGVAVVDGTRLHFFSGSGDPLSTTRLSLPCPIVLPGVAQSSTGLFVSGSCLRRGAASDTMKAVLLWSADTALWHVVIDAPRYTRDGTFGSVFGARNVLTPGIDGVHAFGGGESNCVWRVHDAGERPTATRECPVVASLYSGDPPPELKARMRATRIPGVTLRWPEHLPVYLDRFITSRGILLLRPFTADSLVLQLAGSAPRDVAVAPADGLLGCKAFGCLWLRDETGTPELIVLDRAEIERRIAAVKDS